MALAELNKLSSCCPPPPPPLFLLLHVSMRPGGKPYSLSKANLVCSLSEAGPKPSSFEAIVVKGQPRKLYEVAVQSRFSDFSSFPPRPCYRCPYSQQSTQWRTRWRIRQHTWSTQQSNQMLWSAQISDV